MAIIDYTDKVVLITGAASGFGKLLAEKLAAAGAKLAIMDRNETGVLTVAETLEAQGAKILAVVGDVSREGDCKGLVDAAIDRFGRLDIAVNNAGVSQTMMPLIDTDEAVLDVQYQVNVKGVFFGMKYQIPAMLAQGGGCVLNVSSMAGVGGAPSLGAYAAAKHAVIGLTKTAAAEYGHMNVRVNAICPFFAYTPMFTETENVGMDNNTVFRKLAQRTPMKRLGEAEEVVQVMLMICAPENTYMNGQAVAVDGGMSAA